MNRYLHQTGATQEQCAAVVAKNRRNALRNPSAPYGTDLTLDEGRAGPPLSWPLGHREVADHDADGAIVMVLASEERARDLSDRPVWILGVGWCNGSASLESRDWAQADYAREAARMAYRQDNLDGSPRKEPEVVAFIRLGDGGLVHRLGEVEPEAVAIGMLVEAVFNPPAEREGSILDIAHFRPVGE
jgi:acetyl-CoA C-acetyltransferase